MQTERSIYLQNIDDGSVLGGVMNKYYIDSIKELIEQGVDINCNTIFQNDMTALHVCVVCGVKEIILLLLENGANVESISNEGMTSIMYASRYHYEKSKSTMNIKEWLVVYGTKDSSHIQEKE